MYTWCYHGFTLHADALNWFSRPAPAKPATVPAQHPTPPAHTAQKIVHNEHSTCSRNLC